MNAAETLVTQNLDIWTAAIKAKSSAGRGSSKKIELYGIKKLRELILELAVRGLLVPQDPNDEPASDLLKKIASEKAKLVKEGKIKKEKPLPTIREEEKPFKLPRGWGWSRFGEIYSLEYGENLPEGKRSGTGEYSVYGSNGVVGSHDKACVTSPCVIVGRKGSAGALNLCLDEGCWVTDVAYSVVPPACLDLNFVFRQFHTIGLQELGKGIKPGLSRQEVYVVVIGLPPLAEQPRIVAKVDELMALCDKLEEGQENSISAHETLVEILLAALTNASKKGEFETAWKRIAEHFDTLFTTEDSISQLKQTILQLAVMGRLVPQDPNDEPASELLKKIAAVKAKLVKEGKIKKEKPLPPNKEEKKPFAVPQGWEWVRYGEIFESLQYGTSTKCSYDSSQNTAILRIPNISNGRLSTEDLKYANLSAAEQKQYLLTKNDILMIRSNGSRSLVGLTVPFGEVSGDYGYAGYLMRLRFPDCICVPYIVAVLASQMVRAQIEGPLRTAVGINNINSVEVSNLRIPLPPSGEQHRIVAKVDKLMVLCDKLKNQIIKSQDFQLKIADGLAGHALSDGMKGAMKSENSPKVEKGRARSVEKQVGIVI